MPASVAAQMGLGDTTQPPNSMNFSSAPYRAFSAPAPNENMDVLPPNSPDSSDMGLNDDGSSLADLSEALGVGESGLYSPVGSVQRTLASNVRPAVEKIDRLELGSTGSDKNSGNSVPPTPRPGLGQRQGSDILGHPESGSRQGSAMSGRPGSDRHPVLPPISPKPVDPLPAY